MSEIEKLEAALNELDTHQQQLDMDGIVVGVSREALNNTLEAAKAHLQYKREIEPLLRELVETESNNSHRPVLCRHHALLGITYNIAAKLKERV